MSRADERALAHLMARAKVISRMPGLKKELAGNSVAVAAVVLYLEVEDLPVTVEHVNGAGLR